MLGPGLLKRWKSFNLQQISRITMAAAIVTVTRPEKKQDERAPRPAHHANDTKSLFTNPWPSFQDLTILGMGSFMWKLLLTPPKPDPNIESIIKLQTPTWGKDAKKEELKATWLGHACFLVELPTPSGAQRGPRILYDPVFSHRCSPSAYVGPPRYTSKCSSCS